MAHTGGEETSRVEQLTNEVAALRDKVVALEAEMSRRQGEQPCSAVVGGDEPLAGTGRRRRRSRDTAGPHAVTRRRLFGLVGGAAVTGAGLAVAGGTLTANPAGATAVTPGAADGDALQIGGSNTNSANSMTTTTLSGSMGTSGTGANHSLVSLSSTSAGATLDVSNTAVTSHNDPTLRVMSTNATAIEGTSTNLAGVIAKSTNSNSLVISPPGALSGGVALAFGLPGASGPPTGTGYELGSFWVDSAGVLWQCVVAGTPSTAGTWISLSSPLVQIPPARIYDSRSGQLPSTGPKTPLTTGTTVNLDVTNNSSGVPATAHAVLGNLTVTNSGNGFLTVYATGASQPATSNINLVPGVTLANNFTSKVGTSHEIAVTCGGPGPTDFIVDLFGYYP